MNYRLYFIFALSPIGSVAAASIGKTPEGCGFNSFRLPERIVLYHYDIIMKPDMDALSFEGAVQISLGVVNLDPSARGKENNEKLTANQIVLHADESLKIDNIRYLSFGSKQSESKEGYIEVANICRDQKYQLLVITLTKNLKSGTSGQLHMTFSGSLGDHGLGFYKSAYTKVNISDNITKTRYLVATEFQATGARLAFPCFDEPALKSTFDLTLVHPADRLSVANTDPIYEGTFTSSSIKDFKKGSIESFFKPSSLPTSGANGDDLKMVRFATTPLMSNYLLAFTVGEFDYIEREVLRNIIKNNEDQISGKLRVRVYTPIGRSEQAKFALDTACRAIPLLEDYFQGEFPLNKLDFLALPGYAASDAMENWGLVTFNGLLVDETSSPGTLSRVASSVVHEITHHWIGNLVTMKWWNALWLNEGLTSWMEYKITEQVYPQFQFQYPLDSHIGALKVDSDRQTHQVQFLEKEIEQPSVINRMFDFITYKKVAAIVRILEDNILGTELLKLAIRKYINSNKYSNTVATNLIESIQSIKKFKTGSGDHNTDIHQFLESWLLQPGYPIITVDLVRYGSYELSLKQRRFVTNVHELTHDELKQRWIVPISIVISGGDHRQETLELTMDNSSDPTTVKLPVWFNPKQPGNWLKMNVNFTGFYRVLYPMELFRLMGDPINRQIMSPTDRLNLLDDFSILMLTNMMSSEQLFHLLTWFAHEDHGAVQVVLVDAYNQLLRIFKHEHSVRTKLELFGHRLFGHHNFNPKVSHIDQLGQSAVLSTLIKINHEPTIAEALSVFGMKDERDNNMAAHLREAVYVAVAKRGSDSQFARLFTLFHLTESQEERDRLANAMAIATQTSRLKKVWLWLKRIDNSNTDLKLLGHRAQGVLRNMLDSREGREYFKGLFEYEYTELVKLSNGEPVTGLIEELCVSMGDSKFHEMSQLFSHHKEVHDSWARIEATVKQNLEWQSTLRGDEATKRIGAALDKYLAKESDEDEINVVIAM